MPETGRTGFASEADFEAALDEVTAMLEHPPAPDTAEDRRLNRLLSKIAVHHEDQPPQAQQNNLTALRDLNARLADFGRRWHKENPEGEGEPWSPMVGGDLDPTHHR